MQQVMLNDFLAEQEKLPEDNKLAKEKIDTLKIAQKLADKVYKVDQYWHFIFDDGAFQGEFHSKLPQKHLTPLNLLHIIDGINWPGFKSILEECNESIKEILINHTK